MSSFILHLWAQRQNGIVELLQVLFVLLLFVVPTVLRFFAEKAAQKERQRVEEEALQKHLHEAFTAVSEAPSEVQAVRPRPKPIKKRTRTELVLETDDERPARTSPLVRELAPQGEGSRFDASPGTFDGTLALTPSVEPTVQPTLESMTGIYDVPPGGEQSAQISLAVDIFQRLTTPSGIRQAVVLGEILRQPEGMWNADNQR